MIFLLIFNFWAGTVCILVSKANHVSFNKAVRIYYDRTWVRQKINHKSGTVVFDLSHSSCSPLILVTESLGWICKNCVTEAVIAPSTLLPKELRPTNIMHEIKSLKKWTFRQWSFMRSSHEVRRMLSAASSKCTLICAGVQEVRRLLKSKLPPASGMRASLSLH